MFLQHCCINLIKCHCALLLAEQRLIKLLETTTACALPTPHIWIVHNRCGKILHRDGNAILAQGALCALAAHLRRSWPGSTLLLRKHASLQSNATEEPHDATIKACPERAEAEPLRNPFPPAGSSLRLSTPFPMFKCSLDVIR